MTHSNPTRSSRRARRAIRKLIQSPPAPVGLGPNERRWYVLYTRRIARYLLSELTDEELDGWERSFTVLHELVAQAFSARARPSVDLGELEAWASVSARAHITQASFFTLLPLDLDLRAYVPLIRGFLGFLRDEAAMSRETWQHLDREYAMFDPTERVVA